MAITIGVFSVPLRLLLFLLPQDRANAVNISRHDCQSNVIRTGEKPFKIAFSLAVAVSLVWMIFAYAHAPYLVTWGTASALKPLALVLVAFAFIFRFHPVNSRYGDQESEFA